MSERRIAELEAELAAARQEIQRLRQPAPVHVKDALFTLGKVLLGLQAAAWLLLSFAAFPLYIMVADQNMKGSGVPPVIAGIAMAIFIDAFFAPYGIASIVGIIGLGRGRRWGFVAAVIAAAIGLLCCPPVGALALYAFLRKVVRERFYPKT
jgi:hypothetical protein